MEKLVGNDGTITPTIVVSVHLSEDFIRPFLWGGLVLRHLHHWRYHLVNGLQETEGEDGFSMWTLSLFLRAAGHWARPSSASFPPSGGGVVAARCFTSVVLRFWPDSRTNPEEQKTHAGFFFCPFSFSCIRLYPTRQSEPILIRACRPAACSARLIGRVNIATVIRGNGKVSLHPGCGVKLVVLTKTDIKPWKRRATKTHPGCAEDSLLQCFHHETSRRGKINDVFPHQVYQSDKHLLELWSQACAWLIVQVADKVINHKNITVFFCFEKKKIPPKWKLPFVMSSTALLPCCCPYLNAWYSPHSECQQKLIWTRLKPDGSFVV